MQQNANAERPKDPMVTFRSVKRGKNSKGGDRTELYLTPEMAQLLIQELTTGLANPRGVKIDLHVSEKQYEGRTFDSAICFVKPTQEPPTRGGGFAPRTNAAPSFDAVAKFKQGL